MSGIGIILIHIPLFLPYLYIKQHMGFTRPEWMAALGSATLSDYLVPFRWEAPYPLLASLLTFAAPYNTSWFLDLTQAWKKLPISGEGALFPGFIPIVLALIGGIRFRRRPLVQCLALMILVCVILSFGQQLRVLPGQEPVIEKMPFAYLGLHTFIRVPARFAMAWILPLAMLAGFGGAYLVSQLQQSFQRLVLPVSVLLLCLLGRELAEVPKPFKLYEVSQEAAGVREWLDQQPEGAVLHLPREDEVAFWPMLREVRYQYYSIGSFRPIFNGYSGFMDLPGYAGLVSRVNLIPTPQELVLLRGLGLRFIVAHHDTMKAEEQQLLHDTLSTAAGLARHVPFEGADIYEFYPDPWADTTEAQLKPDQTLYISDGGQLPPAFSAMLAARLHRYAVAGKALLGYRQLQPPSDGWLPDFGLFGADEDPAPAGYNEANLVWENSLFKLIRRSAAPVFPR